MKFPGQRLATRSARWNWVRTVTNVARMAIPNEPVLPGEVDESRGLLRVPWLEAGVRYVVGRDDQKPEAGATDEQRQSDVGFAGVGREMTERPG